MTTDLGHAQTLAVVEARTRDLMQRTNPPDTSLRGAFVDLCEVSAQAFEGTSDAELASHPAAGALVRYLLHAMRTYLEAEAGDDTEESRIALHRAFGVEAIKRGASGTKLTDELALCEEYLRQLNKKGMDVAGKWKPNAHDLAIEEVLKKRPRGMNGPRLEELLLKHGYVTEPGRAPAGGRLEKDELSRRRTGPDAR